MKRGDFFRIYKGNKYDPKSHRVFMVVSRQAVIDSPFSSVICAPVYSKYDDITTQVEVGVKEELKHDSAIYCDELISFPKSILTDYVGTLPEDKIELINAALRIALATG
jgi:mRNA interferase MazF